ncbi:MAG: nitroreductase family protein [Candidatus Heteroscillospira sp.]|jgi:nitroreductase
METKSCIQSRRSVRKYTSQSISQETMNEIISSAVWAPSWKNSQTARYNVVEDEGILEEIASTAVMDFAFNAKTIRRCASLVVMSAVTGVCGYEPDGSFSTAMGSSWEMFDAGIAAQTFCLAAHDMGVGTVILGIFAPERVAELVNLPEGQRVTALIACGYPESEGKAPPRRSAEDVSRYI